MSSDLFKVLEGCGDNSCLVAKPKDMGTNGGCRCFADSLTSQRTIRGLVAHIEDLRADNADMEALFDLQHRRMREATELWRAESPEERALMLPDLGNLLEWLMERKEKQDVE